MIRRLLPLGFLVSLSIPAPAQTLPPDPPVWQGQFFFTALTPQCGTAARTGDFGTAVYRPHRGSAFDGLALFLGRYTVLVSPKNGNTLRGNVLDFMTVITSRGQAAGSGGAFFSSMLNIYPLAISPITPEVTIQGTIEYFFQIPGCTATIEAILDLQP